MAGPQIRESVTVAGRAERARVARAFTAGVLGPGHPCGDDAALLVSELFGNSVRHSRSGAAGGTVTVAVSAGDGLVRVEVTDRGGPEVPELDAAGRTAPVWSRCLGTRTACVAGAAGHLGGRFFAVLLQLSGGLVRIYGRGRLLDRPAPSRRAATEAVTRGRAAPPPRGRPTRRHGIMPQDSRCPFSGTGSG